MSLTQPDQPDLQPLLDALIEDTITPAEEQLLAHYLATVAGALDRYCDYLILHLQLLEKLKGPAELPPQWSADVAGGLAVSAALTTEWLAAASGPCTPSAPPATPPGPPRASASRFKAPVFWSALVANLLFAAYFVGISWNMMGRDADKGRPLAGADGPGSVVPDRAVATITRTEDAEWFASEHTPPRNLQGSPDNGALAGTSLTSGEPLLLASGVVELQLKQGTRLVIKGPAQWSIDGENRATLTQGTLVARVPKEAIGFTLSTPHGTIVDLGTEFAVEVANGRSEVHVVQGTVDVTSFNEQNSGNTHTLRSRQSINITPSGTSAPTESIAVPEKFQSLIDAESQPTRTTGLGPQTGLVAYYPFNGDARDHAAEFTENAGSVADDLAIHGSSEWLAGQVDKGLRLTGGYLTAPVSADVYLPPKFTIEAWIVAETLTQDWQRLVVMWRGPAPLPSIYHLSILGNQLEFSLGQADDEIVEIAGGTVRQERWEHVAVVADGTFLRLYLNGNQVAHGAYDGTIHAVSDEGLGVGDSVGNSAEVHRFHGAIDELAIWNIPLTAEQIRAHAREGRRGYGLTPRSSASESSAPQR